MDVEKLVRQLIRYGRGEHDVWSVVRVPSPEAEDSRQLHRELEVLKEEKKQQKNFLSRNDYGQVWNVATWKNVATLKGHASSVYINIS